MNGGPYWQPAPDGTVVHLPRPAPEQGYQCGAVRETSQHTRYTEAEAKALGLRVCARCKTIAALWPALTTTTEG